MIRLVVATHEMTFYKQTPRRYFKKGESYNYFLLLSLEINICSSCRHDVKDGSHRQGPGLGRPAKWYEMG